MIELTRTRRHVTYMALGLLLALAVPVAAPPAAQAAPLPPPVEVHFTTSFMRTIIARNTPVYIVQPALATLAPNGQLKAVFPVASADMAKSIITFDGQIRFVHGGSKRDLTLSDIRIHGKTAKVTAIITSSSNPQDAWGQRVTVFTINFSAPGKPEVLRISQDSRFHRTLNRILDTNAFDVAMKVGVIYI